MRVLLAGSNSYDMCAAQRLLCAHGATVLTCFSGSKTAAILGKERFDLVVAEIPAKHGCGDDAVNAYDLLTRPSYPPVAVVLDNLADEPEVERVLQMGCVDVLWRPVSEQPQRLTALLHRVATGQLRCGVREYVQAYIAETASTSSCGTLVEECICDNVAGQLVSCSGASTGTYGATGGADVDQGGYSFNQDSPRSSLQVDEGSSLAIPATGIPEELSQPFLADCHFSMPSESCFSADFASMGSSLNTPTKPAATGKRNFGSCFSCLRSESLSSESDDKSSKKQKVEWTNDLHQRFVDAVECLGADKAVPSKILEKMGPAAGGLTRQNIASHLQKYRHRLQRRCSVPQLLGNVHASMPALPMYSCAAPAASGCALPAAHFVAAPVQQPAMPAQSVGLALGSPVLGMPCFGPPQMAWAVPGMGSLGIGSVHPPPCMIPVTATTMQQPCNAEEELPAGLKAAIAIVLRQKNKGKLPSPLGLSLDMRSVMDTFNTRARS